MLYSGCDQFYSICLLEASKSEGEEMKVAYKTISRIVHSGNAQQMLTEIEKETNEFISSHKIISLGFLNIEPGEQFLCPLLVMRTIIFHKEQDI